VVKREEVSADSEEDDKLVINVKEEPLPPPPTAGDDEDDLPLVSSVQIYYLSQSDTRHGTLSHSQILLFTQVSQNLISFFDIEQLQA